MTSFTTPAPVSALTLGPENTLFVGSDDGTLRLYRFPFTKVLKAISKLGADVSSIQVLEPSQKVNGEAADALSKSHVWLAAGNQAYMFSLDTERMILFPADAKHTLSLGEDEEDALNELSISSNAKHLAFSTDAGTVGIVDLTTTPTVTRMRTRHQNICGTVRFIPDRPAELVSGGHDSAVLHFDFTAGTVLSRYDFGAPAPGSGVSLAPPFVQCLAFSPAGALVAGTADGRVWVARGGEKDKSGGGKAKKRSRRWEGLKDAGAAVVHTADGPVVGAAWVGSESVLVCTLLGVVSEIVVPRVQDPGQGEDGAQGEGGNLGQVRWTRRTPGIEKVNAFAMKKHGGSDSVQYVVGGFGKDGKGVVYVDACPVGGECVERADVRQDA